LKSATLTLARIVGETCLLLELERNVSINIR